LVDRKQVLLQQDNASLYSARMMKEKLQELNAIELLPHPAYSPDRVPSDFHLFQAMAHFLHGHSFKTIKDVKMGCHEFFASKDKAWYSHGIELLTERWVQTVELNGLYFEELSSFAVVIWMFKVLIKKRKTYGPPL
jgi:hypothetical protein